MSPRLRSTVVLISIGFFITYVMNACGALTTSAVSFSGGIDEGIIAPVDTDDDGLPDIQENEIGTNPSNPDTDGDGMLDGAEVNTYETDPLVPDVEMIVDESVDSDEDGVTDVEEENLGTDPNNPDSDGGGVTDGEEVNIGLNPQDPADDANLDPIQIQFVTTPDSKTTDKAAIFNFVLEADREAAEVQCYLDGVPTLEDCVIGEDHRVYGLTVGSHAFKVAVRSEYGVLSTETFLWEVELGEIDYCKSGEIKRIQKPVRFQATNSMCEFGKNGNLSKKDRFIRAERVQSEVLDIPTGVKICDVDIIIPKQKLRFDDHIVLSLNNLALLTNGDFLLSEAGADKIYDFSRALNRAAFSTQKAYCYSNDPDNLCRIPKHDQNGEIEMTLSDASRDRLKMIMNKQFSHTLNLSVLGDNDRSDCQQTGLDVLIDITYGIGSL